jgi:hypothetical protein
MRCRYLFHNCAPEVMANPDDGPIRFSLLRASISTWRRVSWESQGGRIDMLLPTSSSAWRSAAYSVTSL